ncbi:MAG TPA: MYXO-CTERM sorting domain-containing protein [Polyangia bacterium]|nr:MYXO-CTERM sorting domain-containing protein [Polyangia bacterium]
MTMPRAGLLLAIVSTVAALPRPAAAYVRYYTERNAPFFWAERTLPITVYTRGFNEPTMTSDQVLSAVSAAADAWSAAQNDCTYVTIQPWASDDPAPRAVNDSHNALIFRSSNWCQLAEDGTCEVDYDSSALAFTWDTANRNTGQIYDADIEVNLVDFKWADVLADPKLASDMDLQNALTHEMGHFLGLDHTCYDPESPGMRHRPTDDKGMPLPDCMAASIDVQDTTMYPSAMPGDTQKRTLAPDDRAGVCGIYPADHPPPEGNLGGGCTCAVGPAPAATAAAALLVAAVLRRRRRA